LLFDRTKSKFKLTNRVVVDIENGHHELNGPVTGPIYFQMNWKHQSCVLHNKRNSIPGTLSGITPHDQHMLEH
jgi:hypothetical protein